MILSKKESYNKIYVVWFYFYMKFKNSLYNIDILEVIYVIKILSYIIIFKWYLGIWIYIVKLCRKLWELLVKNIKECFFLSEEGRLWYW